MKHTKTCYACGPQAQPLEHFYRDSGQPTGRDQLCITHRKATALRYRQRHRAEEVARVTDYRRGVQLVPLPALQIAPHSVVAHNGQRYRIERVEGLTVRLSSGEWIPRSALSP